MRIAWIGVGKMGLPMAGFLLKAGYPVVARDPVPDPVRALALLGGIAAGSVAEAVRHAEIVFTSLPDDATFLEVANGPEGVIAAMRQDAVFVDTSTVSPEASEAVAARAQSRGVAYIRMPVSGNATSAKAGQLTALVSGPADAWARVKVAVEKFTVAQVYLGEGEQARYMKLVVNLLVANTAALMAEALALGRKGGIEWSVMLDALAASTLSSPWLRAKTAALKERDFTPTFTTRQILKDLDLMLAAGAVDGIPMPLTAITRQQMQAVIGDGFAEEDFIAIVKQVERQSGLPPVGLP